MLLYTRKLKKLNFFDASDAERVNSQHFPSESAASVLLVLGVYISFRSVLLENRLFEFSSASIVWIPFSLNQHTSMPAAGISLLAHKRRVYWVLGNGNDLSRGSDGNLFLRSYEGIIHIEYVPNVTLLWDFKTQSNRKNLVFLHVK